MSKVLSFKVLSLKFNGFNRFNGFKMDYRLQTTDNRNLMPNA